MQLALSLFIMHYFTRPRPPFTVNQYDNCPSNPPSVIMAARRGRRHQPLALGGGGKLLSCRREKWREGRMRPRGQEVRERRQREVVHRASSLSEAASLLAHFTQGVFPPAIDTLLTTSTLVRAQLRFQASSAAAKMWLKSIDWERAELWLGESFNTRWVHHF